MKQPLLIYIIFLLGLIACSKEEKPKSNTNGNLFELDTIHIGNQIWMKQALNVTSFNNGTPIELVTDNESWTSKWYNFSKPAYCWPFNDSVYFHKYGALYNWYAVHTGKLCPIGWHVPSIDEIKTLITQVGGNKSSMELKKYLDTAFLYAGKNYGGGGFGGLNEESSWWISDEYANKNDSIEVFTFTMYKDMPDLNLTSTIKTCGASIHCIKD